MTKATFSIWRGDTTGKRVDYTAEVSEGMVVLDAVHQIQATQSADLACRWNCKAGKCGSCSAEINGMPKLMCMTRLNTLDLTQPVTIEPMRAFPLIRDLVTDVSWNFRVKKGIKKFNPRKPDNADGTWTIQQADVDRVQEFRKCIECFLCQDVCHVLRDHQMHESFIGPRYLVYSAALEMHPLDTENRLPDLKKAQGIGLCNITKCCTKVCPESITITDNAIIPLKERVVDQYYDPVKKLFRMFGPKREEQAMTLKTLSHDAIPRALEKADRYRLLNEPVQAESICLDILRVDSDNQQALVILLLALTDQFGRGYKLGDVDPKDVIAKLTGAYERAYYTGIMEERRAKAVLDHGGPRAESTAYDLLTAAMGHYEVAGKLSPAGNDDALLRWNTCFRLMNSRGVKPRGEEPGEAFLE